ncbi:MAG: helix-turn-helix domain-containing protein [Micromonosporaceae bacterium]|nr:helix-turn-helix domain-containing protein [Micromonosporaceae bacterium]
MFRRRRLGEQLRELREAKGYKLQQLAGELGWSHTKLSRLENAKVRPDVADVMDLLEVLDATADQQQRLIALARQANQRGWWKAYAEMPQRQAGQAELEAGAVAIWGYSLVFIPGLLQTSEYMRVRFADGTGFPAFDVEEAIRGRLQRQDILSRDEPVEYTAIIDESVLRRRSAPTPVMYGQLQHLVEIQNRPHVTVRVVPLDASLPYHAAALNSFTVFHFADLDDSDLVSVETETSDVQLGDDEDVARYRVVFDRISTAALSAEASVELIQSIMTGLSDERLSP